MALGDRRILEPSSPRPPPQRPFTAHRGVPWVSGTVLVVSVLAFLVDMSTQGLAREAGALYGPLVVEGQWWRIVTNHFVHGGPFHILMNMSVVWTLGFAFERGIGSWRFLLISIVSALGASIFVLWFGWAAPTVGASGMILGWAGAMLPNLTAQGRRELSTWLIQIAIISALPLFLPIPISWQGHLGGFVFGLPCGLMLRRGREFAKWMPLLVLVSAVAVVLAAFAGRGRGGGA